MFLLCVVPVIVFPALPLIDFYAHALRYDILAAGGADPAYAANYLTDWKLLPNLGLDVIGASLFAVLPTFVAARVLLAIVVAAPVAGVAILAWSLQGRVSPLVVALAGISAHSFILGWGFANFLLGFSMALAGLGLWIATERRPLRQLLVAVPVALVIFITHGFVFALWGLLLFALEAGASFRNRRLHLTELLMRSLRLLVVAALPVVLFLMTDTFHGSGSVSVAFSNLAAHGQEGRLLERLLEEIWTRFDAALRVSESNWPLADRIFGLALWGLIGFGLYSGRFRIDRRLWPVLALLAVIAVIVPPSMFGVGHLSERLPLCILMVVAAGLGVGPRQRAGRRLGYLVIALLPLHVAMVTVGWAIEQKGYGDFLAVADTLPEGGLGNVAYAPGAAPRDEMRSCKPLTFLLAMERRTGVPTFANVTQQPLAIVGPLAVAMSAYDAREAAEGELEGVAQVRAMMDAGFDYVVLCEGRYAAKARQGDGHTGPIEGAEIVGTGRGWSLYRRLRG